MAVAPSTLTFSWFFLAAPPRPAPRLIIFAPPRPPPGGGGPPLFIMPPGPNPPALVSARFPKDHVLATRNCSMTLAGPRAKFRSMVGVPGAGFRLKQPNPDSNFRLLVLQSAGATHGTNEGRAVAMPVLFGSRPVVML